MNDESGQSVIEIILAVAIFVIIVSGVVVSTLGVINLNQTSSEEVVALEFAKEGIEAVRSIKNQNYSSLVDSAATGISNASGVWSFSGVENVFDKYTRSIKIESVQRDASGNIVATGGTLDSNTKKVTATVSWNVSGSRNSSTSIGEYLTNWKQPIGSWTNLAQVGSYDASGNGQGNRVTGQGNYVYLTRSAGTPNFLVIDITNPSSPSMVGSLTLNGVPQDMVISGSYIYIASDDNASELQIVNVSSPNSPTLAGVLNLSGNTNASSVAVTGNTVYLGRVSSGSTEFYKINASNISSPTLSSSLELGGTPFGIHIEGNTAYVASGNNSAELQVINLSLATPVLQTSTNLAGNTDGLSIDGNATNIYLGRVGGEIFTFLTSNLTTSQSVVSVGGDVNNLFLSGDTLFAATSLTSGELSVLNVSTTSTTLVSSLSTTGSLFDVYYSANLQTVAAAHASNTEELVLIKKQ